MKLVVVGGHSRNIGKTSVAAAVIAGTRDLGWTAMKVTQYGHGICVSEGNSCDCAPENPEHPFAIEKEENSGGESDTARFLGAGAAESYWVRTPQGQLGEALPSVRRILDGKRFVLMESNSVMQFLRPDLYLVVLDWSTADFKPSARRHLDRADAFVLVETSLPKPLWDRIPEKLIARRPVFRVRPPVYQSAEMLAFVRGRLLQ